MPYNIMRLSLLVLFIITEGSITSFVITGDEDLVMDWQQGFLNVAADQDIVDGNLYYFSGRSWDDEMSK